ncbi:MAG: chromatin segregation and condensation protein Rec8/ScpA/Scc1 (kleisin family), partial [Candidatus Woesearchaeota archaeon]
DISASINHMYRAVSRHYLQKEGSKRLTFSQLLPSTERQDIVYTFLPLLHLENLNKINLHQKEHFDDFSIDIVGTAKEDLENEFEAVE